jgi:hypothetical protein
MKWPVISQLMRLGLKMAALLLIRRKVMAAGLLLSLVASVLAVALVAHANGL